MGSEHYLLRVTIRETHNPRVTRTLSVPKTTTLEKLHHALRIAFGWTDYHAHKFQMIQPPPARRSDEYSAWLMRSDEVLAEEKTLEQVLENPEYVSTHCQMEYHYDFGDNWELTVAKIGSKISDGAIKCLAGKGHGVVEDCGGFECWDCLKEVCRKVLRADGREAVINGLNEDELERLTWLQKTWLHPGEWLDPDEWSIDDVNARLARDL